MRYYTSIQTWYSSNECSSFNVTAKLPQLLGPWWLLEKDRPTLCLQRPQLKAGAWIHGYSLLVILDYDEACKSLGRGPGSPPPPEVSGPGSAVSLRTDGCDSSSRVHYGSSHQRASSCDVQRASGLLLCDCCSGFFGPV